ncbi:MAG TPA: acyl carrier protein [Saccharospirillum sp.]|nr:acyl carrier protein [Saccharospirillum sp.]
MDSMDSFNLASAIHKRPGVNIPETDFARLQRLAKLVTYLEKHPTQAPGSYSAW